MRFRNVWKQRIAVARLGEIDACHRLEVRIAPNRVSKTLTIEGAKVLAEPDHLHTHFEVSVIHSYTQQSQPTARTE